LHQSSIIISKCSYNIIASLIQTVTQLVYSWQCTLSISLLQYTCITL